MKKSIFIITAVIGMVACNNNKQNNEVEEQVTEEIIEVETVKVEIPLGTEWNLTEINGETVVLDDEFSAQPHIIFGEENFVSGHLGCNSFRGSFEVAENNELKLEHIAATLMACPNLEVEQAFLEVLNTTKSFNVENNTLELRNENQEVTAKFTKAE